MNANIRNPRRFIISQLWCIAAAVAMLAAPAPAQEDQVEVSDYGTVTLTVKDTDLAQVLEMLSIQSRKNIITSKSVSATISANLYDVTFYEALDAILRVNGFGYLEEGNFIYVYTGPELEEINRSRRATESRVFTLQYLAAADAFEFITPLLSDAGQASFRGDVPGGFKPDVGDGGADSYAFTPTLVVNDYSANLDDIAEILGELDSPPTQVMVEATILQTVLDETNAFGVDFSVLGSLDFTDLTAPLTGVPDLFTGTVDGGDDNKAFVGTSTVGAVSGAGGLKIGILTDDISIFLRLLDEVTDSTVLARPKVMCLNRQRAEVLVGARVGYLSTTATETSTTQTVEFLDTGIQLIFRPFISTNGMIRMELAPSVSEASLRTVTDSNGLLVTIPDELTNELTTNVRVPDGQTLVLGGLFRESNRFTRRQIPMFGDLPLLGPLFRGQEDTVDRDEIMFLITPTIVEDGNIEAVGQDMMAYAESARVGARAGLLEFSRSRMTDGYNKKAFAAFARGDTEEALYYTNMSLRLETIQPEMIRFRDQLTGGREASHEQSLMERAIRREVGPDWYQTRPEGKVMLPQSDPLDHLGAAPFNSTLYSPPAPQTMMPNPSGMASASGSSFDEAPAMQPAPALMTPVDAASAAAPMTTTEVVTTELATGPSVQDEFYDDLFKTFFESLGVPELTPPSSAAVNGAVADADVDADVEAMDVIDAVDNMVETTELTGVTETDFPND